MSSVVIHEQKAKKTENWIEKLGFGSFTRFALSGVSVCLVIFFAAEYGTEYGTEKPKGPVAGLRVILNSQSLRKNLSEPQPEKKSLLSQCTNRDNTVDLTCLKTKLKF